MIEILLKKISFLIKKVNTEQDTKNILDYIYNTFDGCIPFDRICLVLFTDDKDNYSNYVICKNKSTVEYGYKLNLYKSYLKDIIKNKKPKIINRSIENNLSFNIEKPNFNDVLETSQSNLCIPIIGNEICKGVIIFYSSNSNAYCEKDIVLGEIIANCIVVSLEKCILDDGLIIACVKGFAKLVESKDSVTGKHIERIQEISKILALNLANNDKYKNIINNKYIIDIYHSSAMHDIGKVGIPDGILLKQGKLTPEEFDVIKKHTIIGADVLYKASTSLSGRAKDFFKMAIDIAIAHHEKFDGTGYPYGLNGEYIPLAARIVAVADVLDALSSKRPYKMAMDVEEAINIVVKESGKHFDHDIVDALITGKKEILEIYDKFKEEI
ncbi:HD domain-containing phosphohydrolase [Clostridium sp. MB40-C1]|uniref:HD-GYP domain-containing protein n=1 Tax=Clostridium sp. MB40-C1 TaxID=3070996 RepID=UPI0027DF44F1|nr:HD domain-containing phosphohydrolase [Clostridium sp. MB40-C1]WMJ81813.1 HD domain-containing phosphohydrolase [Clostridium sp. MB40-C1]